MTSALPRHAVKRRRVSVPAIAGLAVGAVLAAVLPAQLATAAPSTVVSDSFARMTTKSWGTANRGGTWTQSATKGTTFRVGRGHGVIATLPGGGSARLALDKVAAQNTDVKGTFTLPTSAGTLYTALEVRRQKNKSAYRGRIELTAKGVAVLAISRLNGTKDVNLGRFTLPGTYAPGTSVTAEFQVTGSSTVYANGRAWKPGDDVPEWQLSVKDRSASRISAAGSLAVWQYAGSSNRAALTTTLDDLTLVKNPDIASSAPVATPTPTAPVDDADDTPPTLPSRGSAEVGTTQYAVPAGALVVSPSGSDAADGSLATPLRTLAAAVARATTGQTIVLRAGDYNESVLIPRAKTLTVQSYPGEAVWFDGSKKVTAWSAASNARWVADWSYFPSNQIDGIADNPYFVDAAKPFAARPDQVFIDDRPLTQVGSADAVTAGTFYPDAANGRMILGTDPTDHTVRVSNQQQAIVVQSPNTVLKGFGVRKYGTSYLQRGAIRISATGVHVENLDIEDNAMIGINVENDAVTLDHLTVTDSGLLGIGVNSSYGFEVENSITSDNNAQLFKAQPVAGGIKITRSRGVTVKNIEADDNAGNGIWLDESVYDATLVDNTANDNTVDGMLLELSDHIVVANNELSGNKIGVIIYNTANVQVFNNEIGNNRQFGIKLAQDTRRQANTALTGHDRRQPVPDPTLTWIVKNITVSNNVFGSGGLYQIYGLDGETNIPVDAMDLVITGNLFNQRLTASQAILVGWGQGDNRTVVAYNTVHDLAAAKGTTWNNVETGAVLPLAGMGNAIASSKSVAVGLPADVAAALGVKAGLKALGNVTD